MFNIPRETRLQESSDDAFCSILQKITAPITSSDRQVNTRMCMMMLMIIDYDDDDDVYADDDGDDDCDDNQDEDYDNASH